MDLHLAGRVVLITGASRGIGLATAACFAAEGAGLVLSARGADGLRAAAASLGAAASVLAVPADVTDAAQAEALVSAAVRAYGGIDVLVNNVGGSPGGRRLAQGTDEDWRLTLELNLVQTVRMMRLAAPHMAGRAGAAIVNIASIAGWTPQLAGSILVPGNGWDRYRLSEPDGYADYVANGFPMGRLGSAEEVADVIAFLASPRAHWINGRNIPVDGLEQPYPAPGRRPF